MSSVGSSSSNYLTVPEAHPIIKDGSRDKIGVVLSKNSPVAARAFMSLKDVVKQDSLKRQYTSSQPSVAAAASSSSATKVASKILTTKATKGKIPELYTPQLSVRAQPLPVFHCASKKDLAELRNMLADHSGKTCLCLKEVVMNAWEMREKCIGTFYKFSDKKAFSLTDPLVLEVVEMRLKGEPILRLLKSMSFETLVGFKKLIVNYCSEHRYFEKTASSQQ